MGHVHVCVQMGGHPALLKAAPSRLAVSVSTREGKIRETPSPEQLRGEGRQA